MDFRVDYNYLRWREYFSRIFPGILFTKKEDIDGKSIFVARIYSMETSGMCNYIILVCSYVNKSKGLLKDLPVRSIQTRRLKSYFFRTNPIVWKSSSEGYDLEIVRSEKTRQSTKYITKDTGLGSHEIPTYGLEVLLFNNPKKKDVRGQVSMNQYPSKMTVRGALETFRCVINLTDTTLSGSSKLEGDAFESLGMSRYSESPKSDSYFDLRSPKSGSDFELIM